MSFLDKQSQKKKRYYQQICTIRNGKESSSGQNTGVGSFSLLQGIFPPQGWNPGLLHGRQILYQLNHREANDG